jgi:hypothetical protein
MGLMDYLRGQLIDIIEWTDDSRDTISFRFPDNDAEIKRGAQLIVRESQVAQFVYLGEFGDTFGPGKHTLTTDNIPILTSLKSWKYGFESPFKADVYFVTTRLFTGNKWGTSNPIMLRDQDFGIVRVRAFGTYDFRVSDPKLMLKEVAGSDHNFRLDEFTETMRSRIVSTFSDAIASRKSGARCRDALPGSGRRAAPAHQPDPAGEIRNRARELRARERLRSAGSRAGDRQALEHGGRRQSERVREIPDGAGDGERRQRGRHGDGDGRRHGDGAADHAAAELRAINLTFRGVAAVPAGPDRMAAACRNCSVPVRRRRSSA